MVTLRQALLSSPTGLLNRVAQAHGLRVDAATLRPELVAALASILAERAADGSLWADLSDDEARVAAIVARTERGVEADTLVRRALAEAGGDGDPAALAAAVARLVDRGVAFRLFQADGPSRGTYVVMPDEPRAHAAAHLRVRSPLLALARPAPPPDGVRRIDVARNVFALASALRRDAWNAAARPTGGRPERRLDGLLARLPDVLGDPARAAREYWAFLVALGRRGGWLAADGWPTPDDRRVLDLLRDEAAARAALWRAHLSPAARAAGPPRLPPAAEHGVAQALAEAPVGTWFDATALAEHLAAGALAASAPGVADTARRPSEAGEGRRPTPARAAPGADGPGGERAAAGADAVLSLLLGPWHWLGLVDAATGDDGRPLAGVAPGLADALGAGAGQPRPAAPCSLGDDLALLAPPGADRALLYEAEPYLAFDRDDGGARRYRLTPGSFARGVRLGGSAELLLALLERLGDGPPPERWRAAVEAWLSSGRRLRASARVVLEADDPRDLRRALDALGDAAPAVEPAAETLATVRPDRLLDVLRRLGDAGIPVDVAPELRLDPHRPERAAALGAEGTDAVFVVFEALRRLDAEVVRRDPALAALAAALDATTPAAARPVLERRAAALAARLVERRGRRPPGGGAGRA